MQLEIKRIKKTIKKASINGIWCKIDGQKIDGTVCMLNQIRKPHECVDAGCRNFKGK